MEETPGVVLAVYAHPDDADVACGGTLARWAKAGGAVHLVVCTDGGKGTADPAVVPGELAARARRRARGVVGADRSRHRRQPRLSRRRAHRLRRTSGVLSSRGCARLRPDVVCGHDPTAVFFGQDYFNHRDHRIAGAALLDAVAPAAALPLYFPDAGPPHQVSTVLLSATLEPDEWVDISDTVETKASAVECHRTQFADQDGWAGEAVRRRAAEEGRRAGVAYAEGFRRLTLGG